VIPSSTLKVAPTLYLSKMTTVWVLTLFVVFEIALCVINFMPLLLSLLYSNGIMSVAAIVHAE
jgi:hypothetical protein